jgi:CPA1 family monovalent cation:H+ antiporter
MRILDAPAADWPVCPHAPVASVGPRARQCEECGSRFNLRSCATCGHVGCCESQVGHARAHALGEGHPVIEQITGHGMGFAWCYDEHRYVR